MGLFNRKENRATGNGTVQGDESLLEALTGGDVVTKAIALQLPMVSGSIDLIANVVASTPIKLYREENGTTKEVLGDPRVALLNDETGDTLSAADFWRAMVHDYYVGKGAYAYINKECGTVCSLHYVDEERVSILKSEDPIFKDYNIRVNGKTYLPFEFFKILRNSKDGITGIPIQQENSRLIEAAYRSLILERNMARRGGRKKGFLESEKMLAENALAELRRAFARLYGSGSGYDEENFVVLNGGIKFNESTNTAVEMQLNETKQTNAQEFARIFHVSADVVAGRATNDDISSLANVAVLPLMYIIQCALNRDLLLEKEKGKYYFAFDTKELLKGNIKERFEAYKTALEANFMQIDEVRFKEDLPPLGLTWIKLGLQDVLYDPKNNTIYTPNTNKMMEIGNETPQDGLNAGNNGDIMEERRANDKHDPKTGRFAKGGGKRTKYSPSQRRNSNGISLSPKRYARVCGLLNTKYPGLKEGETRSITDSRYRYYIIADGYGGFSAYSIKKIK